MASGSDDVLDHVSKRVIVGDYTVHGEIHMGGIKYWRMVVNLPNFNLTKVCL